MATNIRTTLHAFTVVALLVSVGCATSGALQRSGRAVTTPTTWQNAAQGVVTGSAQDLSRWWEQLGDSTLISLIDRTLQGSPDMASAQARLRQARAQRNVSASELKPTVSAGSSASVRNDSSTTFSPGFDASWEPDIFGGTRSGVAAATADLQATAADLYATQVSLAAEVARTYVELRTLQSRLAIARENAASQAETLELTGFRAQAGLVSTVDVERARANVEQTRSQIPSLEASVTQAMHRLSTLAGLEPSALKPELEQAEPLPQVPERVVSGIPAETLRQRPDVRAAELSVRAETARVAQADANRYPQFTLSGSLGANIVTGALTGGTSLVTAATSSILQTLFDGGRIDQQIEIQNAIQEQAVSAYESTVLTALEEVENALVAFEKSRERLESLNAAETAAVDAATLARTQYEAGLTDFEAVLDTERTVLTVQDSIATTEGDRMTTLIQLYKALGGGWSPMTENELMEGVKTS